jgi:hypothetical protein
MDNADGDLLPGERVLWSGRPAQGRIGLGDAGLTLYLVIALAVLVVSVHGLLRHLPALVVAAMAIFYAGAVIQVLTLLVHHLVVKPLVRRRSGYQLTDLRINVTGGLRSRRVWSAYLDQVGEPSVRRHRDGTEDLVFRDRQERDPQASFHVAQLFGQVKQPRPLVLHSLTGAAQAQQAVAAAQCRALGGLPLVPTPGVLDVSVPLPAAVRLKPGERALWAGRPGTVPWWFGLDDVLASVYGAGFFACSGLVGAWAASSGTGSASALVVLVPLAAGSLYLAAGRLVHRRVLIRRSSYVVTDRRLITLWESRGKPVAVQAPLAPLLPPEIRGQSIRTAIARPDPATRRPGWSSLVWPTTTTSPPTLIGVRDPRAVRDLICAAQLASRTMGSAQPTGPA